MSECGRLKSLELPKNDANICWWLSVNLALFHKRRPEFDVLLSGGGDYIDQFSEIYTYYSGHPAGAALIQKERLTTIRTDLADTDKGLADGAAEAAAKAAGAPAATSAKVDSSKDEGFSINSTKPQSVSEYFLYLRDKITPGKDSLSTHQNVLDSFFIPIINAEPHGFQQAYDVYYHSLYFGLRRELDDKNPPDMTNPGLQTFYEFPDSTISDGTGTVVLSFERKLLGNYSSYTIIPLEKITLPTSRNPLDKPRDILNGISKDDIENAINNAWKRWIDDTMAKTSSSIFELDAMTVSSPGGGHFVTYIKCGEEWLYDNGLSEGPLGTKDGSKVFKSFADMMNDEHHGKLIRENLLLLYYSNVSNYTGTA